MKLEYLPNYAILLEGEPRIKIWTWGFKKYGGYTSNRQRIGHHGITIRINTTLIIITLPGKGRLGRYKD